MTMYDDSRVVTLLREIDPPMAPPDRLGEVSRRARRGETRRASALAGAMALVLAVGVVSAINLGNRGKTEVLTVAGAARATKATGSAVMTMRATLTHSVQPAIPDGDLFTLSGPVDFKRQAFAFKGAFGTQKMELRGIGKDRWTKQELTFPGVSRKPWTHTVDTAPVTGLNGVGTADPGELLDALISKGTVLSTREVGDRTRTVLRLPADVLGSGFGATSKPATMDATVESDADGRIRMLTSEVTEDQFGTLKTTVAFDHFGIDVNVQPPPADQVSEAGQTHPSGGFSVTVSGSGTSSPGDVKKACEQMKAFDAQMPPARTEQEKAQRRQFDEVFAKTCGKS